VTRALLFGLLLLPLACDDGDSGADAPNDGVAGGAPSAGGFSTGDFTTGEFTVTTTAIDDACLDGGLNLLFMPQGPATPWEWPFPITLYAPDALPQTYPIQLREPFGAMTLDATAAGPSRQTLAVQENPAVALGDPFGACVAGLAGRVDLIVQTANTVSGTATLQLSDPRGDEQCPADMPAECGVVLTFQGLRVGG
jgi:hypothetical protein